MIDRAKIARSLNAVWLLFLDRPNAIDQFDASPDGFWDSFQAIAIVAPIYAFTVLVDLATYLGDPEATATAATASATQPFDVTNYLIARACTLVIDWATLPLLLGVLASALGIRAGYMRFIVARNWSAVFTLVPYALVSLLEMAGLFDGQLVLIPAGIALAIALRVSYLTARRALQVPVDVAIGYVLLDFLVSYGLADAISYAFGVPAG